MSWSSLQDTAAGQAVSYMKAARHFSVAGLHVPERSHGRQRPRKDVRRAPRKVRGG